MTEMNVTCVVAKELRYTIFFPVQATGRDQKTEDSRLDFVVIATGHCTNTLIQGIA